MATGQPGGVKDKKGTPIDGLSAKDFSIAEDGVPQEIRFCEKQNLPETPSQIQPLARSAENVKVYRQLALGQIAPEAPGDIRYKDRRLLAFYFDMTAMQPPDQMRALAAAQKFIRTQMTPADLVAILRYSGGSVDVLQDFTADRNRLLSIIETMVVGEGQDFAEEESDASAADTGAAFGQDDSEFNIFNTDRQLSALQTAAHLLGRLNERKSLLYFAGGLRLNGVDNQAQLRATIDAAIRAGVSFWPIDARGLVAQAPLGDATQGSPGNSACTPEPRRWPRPMIFSNRRIRSTRLPVTRAAKRSSTITTWRRALCRRSAPFPGTTFLATTPRMKRRTGSSAASKSLSMRTSCMRHSITGRVTMRKGLRQIQRRRQGAPA